MTPDEIRAGLETMFAAYNAGDADGFVAGAAQDIQVSFDGLPTFDNRDDFRDYAKSYYDWTSDAKVTIQQVLVDGDQAAVELTQVSTHDRGPLYGVEATGKTIQFTWSIGIDFENGKLQRLRVFFNPMVILEQLGVLDTEDPS